MRAANSAFALLVGVLVALIAPLAWSAESAVPAPLGAERYAEMGRRCPFALASPVAPLAAPQASFAANWYVSGIARLGDTDFVTIKARDLATQFSLYGREPNPQNQVTLVGIEWVEAVGKSIVTIRKDAETAKLEFNEAEVRGPGQASAAAGLPANGKPPLPGAMLPPLPAGARPIPVGAANGAPQRYLKTVPPPTNLPPTLPNGSPAPAGSPYQPGSGVPRRLPPGIPRPATATSQQIPR